MRSAASDAPTLRSTPRRMADPVLVNYRTDGGVAIIELCNPPANAYSYAMFRQLDDAILAARMDESVHVLLLTAAGEKFFCAGADIAMLTSVTAEFKYYFCLHANETLLRLEHTAKLVIAAINGHCVGGGLEVAMACDLRIAKQSKAKFGLPEVALGVLPGTGGTQRLSRIVGRSKAMQLMLDGERFDAEQALQLGLVHKILPAEDFAAAAVTFAKQYCPPNKAAGAAGLIKRAVATGSDLPLEAGLSLERELQQRLFTGQDAKIGLAAFGAGQAPVFTGK